MFVLVCVTMDNGNLGNPLCEIFLFFLDNGEFRPSCWTGLVIAVMPVELRDRGHFRLRGCSRGVVTAIFDKGPR